MVEQPHLQRFLLEVKKAIFMEHIGQCVEHKIFVSKLPLQKGIIAPRQGLFAAGVYAVADHAATSNDEQLGGWACW